jgi:hypothetical protein
MGAPDPAVSLALEIPWSKRLAPWLPHPLAWDRGLERGEKSSAER